jgi:hypothetical protein
MNKIKIENQLQGTLEWQLTRPAIHREIEGYASRTSIDKGGSISLFVNTKAKSYRISIFRMGWYQGLGARLVSGPHNLNGTEQAIPLPDALTGKVECDWVNPYILKTETDWTSGVYLAKLEENELQKQSYILFVLRDDSNPPDILFQLPVTTYQAYNFWGGKSLYDWGSGSLAAWGTVSGKRANKVSFNRPYARSNNPKAAHGMGAGEFLTNIQPVTTHFYPISSASWDYNMVRWLEKNGYDVGYITNIDTHSNVPTLRTSKLFMSHGHDEYWSAGMRNNVESARDIGTHLAFFSSNTMFWQIRLEPDALNHSENRTMVCYKDLNDPVQGELATVNFRDPPVNRPESQLIGIQYVMDPVDGDITVTHAEHPIFRGTGLKDGDQIKGVLGYEIDGLTPYSPSNVVVLATSEGRNLLDKNYGYLFKCLRQKIVRKVGSILPVIKGKTAFILILALLIPFLATYFIIVIFGKMGMWLLLSIFTLGFLLLLIKKRRALKNLLMAPPKSSVSHMTLYQTKGGATVFATGSMQWAWGLDDFNVPQLRTSRKQEVAEIITRNLLQLLVD